MTIWQKCSLGFLCLLATVPFLNPHHRPPLPAFYEEWTALVLGILAAASLFKVPDAQLHIPRAIALPGILLAVVAIQYALGMLVLVDIAYIHVGYFVWAMLMLIVGKTLTAHIGEDNVFQPLAIALTLGAALSALIGLSQALGLQLSPTFVFPSLHSEVVGNIAQRNLLTSYLWVGTAAVLYLHDRERIRFIPSLCLIFLLSGVAGLTASRMGILHSLVLLLAAWITGRHTHNKLLTLATVAVCIGLVSHTAFGLLNRVTPTPSTSSAVERLGNVSSDARLDLWRDALPLIQERPWLGNGVGNFPWRAVEAASLAPPRAMTWPGQEHSHNIVLQIAADFGIPTATFTIFLAFIWLNQTTRVWLKEVTKKFPLGLVVLGILLMHSMLEYPLWYAEWLGLCCLVVGVLSRPVFFLSPPQRSWLLPGSLILGVIGLVPLLLDYRALERASNDISPRISQAEWRDRIATVTRLTNQSALGSYALIPLGLQLEPLDALAKEQSYVCERVMRIWPNAVVTARCAVLRYMLDDKVGAQTLLLLAFSAYRQEAARKAIREVIQLAETKNPKAAGLGVFFDSISNETINSIHSR